MIRIAIIAGSVALLIGVIANAVRQHSTHVVDKERVRVETEARKKNEAAQSARKRVTPGNAHGVLNPFYRD
jgi:hypothetical protein